MQNSNGRIIPQLMRTPGYPVFLAITHNLMKIPLSGVVFLQVLLTILVAWIVYKTALQIDSRVVFLSAIIILFDLPITVFSLKILTETLFLLLVSIFIYTFTRYLKTGKTGLIILSSLAMVMATYTRPISYYLGGTVAIFIIYANVLKNFKKVFRQALIFLVIVYGLIGLWQIRNYRCCNEKFITTIARTNFQYYGLIKGPQNNFNYAYESWRSLLSLMTRPGTLKYFNSKPLAITAKVLAYPWMVLWMIGFLAGVYKIRRNIYYQFLLLVIIYFVGVSVFNLSFGVSERFRVPIVPCIAIISAYGWLNLFNRAFKNK